MSDQDEQLYGRAQTEREQGYTPLVHSVPDEPAEPAIDSDSALVRHLERPAPPPPVERAYHDVQSGEPTDDHSTVELNRAAKDISEVRAAEALEVDKQRNADLNEALDFLAQEQSALAAAAAPQPADEQVTGRIEAQPDYQPQPESVQQATDPQYDPELLRALQDPKVRGILERASQGIEATNAQFQQELANAALTATASFMSAFPELNGLSAEQLPGAVALIAKNDPVRAQAIAHHYRQVSHLVAQHQRVAVQQQEQQQTRAAEQFRAYAAAHDAVSLRNETPESVKAIQSVILEDAKRAGISEKDLAQVWNSVPAFRHSFVQDLLADGAKYRLAQRSVARAAHRPVPHVVRPGSPAEMQTRTEAALAEARSKLKPSMSAKEAAAYVIARRAAR